MISNCRDNRLLTISVLAALITWAQASGGPGDLQPPPPDCELIREHLESRTTKVGTASVFPSVQLEVRTPFEPTAFPSGGRAYLIYELHLRTFGGDALALRSVEVVDAEGETGSALASSEAGQLRALFPPKEFLT